MRLRGGTQKSDISPGSDYALNNPYMRQDKMVYSGEPTNQPPPDREWLFTCVDTGPKVGVKYNLVIISGRNLHRVS